MTSSSVARHRSAALLHQSGRCYYCSVLLSTSKLDHFAAEHQLSLPQVKPLQCTAEHMRARRDGGTNAKANIVAACWFCNHKRHARPYPLPPDQYLALVQKRIRQGRWHNRYVYERGLVESPRPPC